MEKTIPYEVGGRKLEGMLVWDERAGRPRPGVLVQCDRKGVCRDTVALASPAGQASAGTHRPAPWGNGGIDDAANLR